jgi:hypothetical protein
MELGVLVAVLNSDVVGDHSRRNLVRELDRQAPLAMPLTLGCRSPPAPLRRSMPVCST